MPHRTARGRRTAVSAVVAALALGLSGTMAQAATGAARPGPAALADSQPSWATARADQGAVPASSRMSVEVLLSSQDPSGLAAYAQAVSSPGSPEYHHYLTPAQQNARFGPTAAQSAAVRSWLTGSGLKVTSSTEQYVSVAGTAAQLTAAFSTPLHNYAVGGHTYYAPQHPALVPAAVADAVVGVEGLDNAPHVNKPASAPATAPSAGNRLVTGPNGAPYIGANPCTSYYDQSASKNLPKAYGGYQPYTMCGYLPGQLRSAYQIPQSGLSGKGVTVAIVDAYGSSTIESDVDTFDKYSGFPQFKAGQFADLSTPADFTDQSSCGDWTPEESLDVEEVHTMAPDAKINYVGANSCNDIDFISAESDIVDNHLADVVSDSYTEDLYDTNGNTSPVLINAYNQVFEEGAAEGIGFYFASGDCADDAPAIVATGVNCDTYSSEPQTTFQPSIPWVTAVGATAIGIGKNQNYEFETGMGDSKAALQNGTTWSSLPGSFIFGSGGGTSNYFAQPWYQKGVVPDSLADTLLTGQPASQPMREVPDVAMEGDLLLTTMVGFTQKLPDGTTGFAEQGYGGTSIACPLFAGEQSDAEQSLGFPIGFANPEIYAKYQSLGTQAFHPVTDNPGGQTKGVAYDKGLLNGVRQGDLYTLGTDYTLKATPGYNDVSGLGSPTLGYLKSFKQ
ncbi:S53 family peptidase [Kitasatospora sp. NBC_01266]|uniref:S53 family peptidase n=1 Tax=Kitasatospora sp. NBC_01266 TaxID=2903572 RepID=UPI002E36274A|nr:S53 family peptidase [Kitasatospora sp. NBC_01266]